MQLDEESGSQSPLPDVLSHGLVAVSTFGLLSFFCSTSLFFYLSWRLITWRRWRRASGCQAPTNQFLLLIYNLLFADIQQALAFLLNIGALKNNAILIRTPLCFAQGWFVSSGDLASSVFICFIAVHTFFGVVKNYRLPTWAFYTAIGLCWFFIYFISAIGPILHGPDFYVRAAAWCWINRKFSHERLWSHYLWIFVAMFSTILIYTFIYIWLRRQQRAGRIHKVAIENATPLMILYPLIYTVCTAPLASLRIYSLAGHKVSLPWFCMAGTMIACNGWLDVLLYASTRSDIVFAEMPPGEGTGLDTFNFMGKQVTGSGMGTTTTVSAGAAAHSRDGSRIALRMRSPDQRGGDHLYSMGQISVTGEITVSSASLEEGIVRHASMGKQASASSVTSPTLDGRSMKSVRSEFMS
ncbi:hypothetical protein HYFRA_00005033 [Hymenoscyphus fraxineus]|uniref:G-protein coupled receptors family 1 profile domain-containing protein n=1 Tax=Hymenoscyphus fraxineus TaxID=746836 RepID=A0A9N9KLC5_9HELO|nr:hypothetical protein HYFRA_00005033 [Hymenoscyphus fraxineus]